MVSDPELIRRYAEGERDFSGLDLRGIRLYGSVRQLINLSGANFKGAILAGAILSLVDLQQSDLREANLKGARIRGNLSHTDLSGSDLSHAQISGSSLVNTRFRGANLTNADLGSNSLGYRDLDFREAECTDAKLTCDLMGSNFEGANVKRALFFLPGLHWYRANLQGTSFRGVDLSGQDLSGLDLSGADLRGANLFQAKLAGTQLTHADLQGAHLRAAVLTRSQLRGANFTHADLTHAVLSDAEIEGANGLDLTRTIVSQAPRQTSDMFQQQSQIQAVTFPTWLNDLNFGYPIGRDYFGYRYEPIEGWWKENPLAAHLAGSGHLIRKESSIPQYLLQYSRLARSFEHFQEIEGLDQIEPEERIDEFCFQPQDVSYGFDCALFQIDSPVAPIDAAAVAPTSLNATDLETWLAELPGEPDYEIWFDTLWESLDGTDVIYEAAEDFTREAIALACQRRREQRMELLELLQQELFQGQESISRITAAQISSSAEPLRQIPVGSPRPSQPVRRSLTHYALISPSSLLYLLATR